MIYIIYGTRERLFYKQFVIISSASFISKSFITNGGHQSFQLTGAAILYASLRYWPAHEPPVARTLLGAVDHGPHASLQQRSLSENLKR